jgi:hypothetical protein
MALLPARDRNPDLVWAEDVEAHDLDERKDKQGLRVRRGILVRDPLKPVQKGTEGVYGLPVYDPVARDECLG